METKRDNNLLFNRNDKQFNFNEIKGSIFELNEDKDWCSITLSVGHENQRLVNFSMKATEFDKIKTKYLIGDKIAIRFYLTSRFKNGRWYTIANILQMDAVTT